MNQTLKCVDCGSDFNFGDKDQAFFARGGAEEWEEAKPAWNPPKRGKSCRIALKEKKQREKNGN